MLTPEIRHRALALRNTTNVTVTPGLISWTERGKTSDPERLIKILDLLVLVARQILLIEAPHLLEPAGAGGPATAPQPPISTDLP